LLRWQKKKRLRSFSRVTEDLARFYGDVRAGFPKGETKENFDLMIATTAMFYDLILVSNDKIFKNLELKLKLENWSAGAITSP